jgi:hypothetical protein
VASAPIWEASQERMRSAVSAPRPSGAAIGCGGRISARQHQPMRQQSTLETASV